MSRRKKLKNEGIIGPPWLTKYEKARVLGVRAKQLAMGAPPLVEVPKGITNPLEIAKLELEAGVIPIIIERRLPDGRKIRLRVSDLVKIRRGEKPWLQIKEKL